MPDYASEYGSPLPIQEVKAAGDSWEVSGYVSTYGNRDRGGDVVLKGAFDGVLADPEHKTVFLYGHDPRQVLGVPLTLKSDDHGLVGRFKISKTPLGETVHTLLKDGALDSFSIGFVTKDADYDEDGFRLLKELDLIENSVVAIPMNQQALVTSVKYLTLDPAEELDVLLKKRLALDPEQPFETLWDGVLENVSLGVQQAKALHARRRKEHREVSGRLLDVIRQATVALENAARSTAALLATAGQETTEERPTKETEVPDGVDYREQMARVRQRLAALKAQVQD